MFLLWQKIPTSYKTRKTYPDFSTFIKKKMCCYNQNILLYLNFNFYVGFRNF